MALLNDILNRYLGGAAAPTAQDSLADDFHHVAHNVPGDVLSSGLSAALNSSQTPAAGQMISQMFEASTPEQRAAMLNQLIAALGTAAPGVLGGILGPGAAAAGTTPTIDADQASTISPEQVQDVVTKAQQRNPDIVSGLSDFYAQHPTLVKTLGGAALAIVLGKISQHMKG